MFDAYTISYARTEEDQTFACPAETDKWKEHLKWLLKRAVKYL